MNNRQAEHYLGVKAACERYGLKYERERLEGTKPLPVSPPQKPRKTKAERVGQLSFVFTRERK